MANGEAAKADVLQGTLDLMVLQTLDTLGPQHGYAIAARLEQVSSGALQLNMGTLYPGLMRLEQRGLVKGAWGTTDANRKARFYALTAAGRRELAERARGLGSHGRHHARAAARRRAESRRPPWPCCANGSIGCSARCGRGAPTPTSKRSCGRTPSSRPRPTAAPAARR